MRSSWALVLLLMGLQSHTAHSDESQDPSVQKVIEDYCTSVSDLAAEQRTARQMSALKELEERVEKQLNLLEQRTQALTELIRKRQELRNLAEKELLDIYAGVDAEAASAQMERLDLRLASSVLRQLKPRQASAILDVMKPELAAELVRLIAVPSVDEKATQ